MKKVLGITLISATGLLLAGCLGTDQSTMDQERAASVQFIRETSGIMIGQIAEVNPANEAIKASLEQLGCPKLADLFGDLLNYTGQNEFPQSFSEHLSCFGLSATPTADQIDGIHAKFGNPEELLNCICGGTGLTDYLKGIGYPLSGIYDGSVKAASAAFDGSVKGASGSFDGSSNGATGTFDGSVKGASGSFGD